MTELQSQHEPQYEIDRETTQLLMARAEGLAKKQSLFLAEDGLEIVEFLLAGDDYAFEIDDLREVCSLTGVTYIPYAPSFVAGVINLRGQVVPIIDLKVFLNIETDSPNVFNKAIILQKDRLVVGFLADEVVGARKVALRQLQYSLPTLSGISAEYLKAITDERLVILDANKIMRDKRLSPDHPEQL